MYNEENYYKCDICGEKIDRWYWWYVFLPRAFKTKNEHLTHYGTLGYTNYGVTDIKRNIDVCPHCIYAVKVLSQELRKELSSK